jgi:hypothetical protein
MNEHYDISKKIAAQYPRIFTINNDLNQGKMEKFFLEYFLIANPKPRPWHSFYNSTKIWHLDDYTDNVPYDHLFYLAISTFPHNTQYLLSEEEYKKQAFYENPSNEIFTPLDFQIIVSRCDVYHRMNPAAKTLPENSNRVLYREQIAKKQLLEKLFQRCSRIILPAKPCITSANSAIIT